MSRTQYFDVTVLAADAAELSRIADQLREPSPASKQWVHDHQSDGHIFDFSPVGDLLNFGERKGGACKLRTHLTGAFGLAYCHLLDVSAAFPSAVFLMEAYDMDSFTEKMVFHGGRLLRATHDNDSHVQGGVWVLLNIFVPFKVEYELALPVGSLWDEWVADVTEAAHELRVPPAWATEPPELLDLTFADELPGVVKQPKPGQPKDFVQKQLHHGVWRTLCNICHRPIAASWEGFPDNGDEDFGFDPDRSVCFEVVPCNVTVEPTLSSWDPNGAAENWRKKKPMTFVVCAGCLAKLGVVPTQLPVTPVSTDGYLQDGAIAPDAVVKVPKYEHDLPPLEDLADVD
jgi:hypothetical protein